MIVNYDRKTFIVQATDWSPLQSENVRDRHVRLPRGNFNYKGEKFYSKGHCLVTKRYFGQ